MDFIAVTISYPELDPHQEVFSAWNRSLSSLTYDLSLESAINRQIVCAGAEPERWRSADGRGWYTVINCTEEQRRALVRAIKICFGGAVKVS